MNSCPPSIFEPKQWDWNAVDYVAHVSELGDCHKEILLIPFTK